MKEFLHGTDSEDNVIEEMETLEKTGKSDNSETIENGELRSLRGFLTLSEYTTA